MDIEARKQKVRDAFQALADGDAGAWLALFRDDLVWRATPNQVFPAEVEGKSEVVARLLVPLTQKLEEPLRIVIDELIGEGERVVALARGRAKTRMGEAYDQSYCFIFRFDGDQVVEVDERLDSALVNRVLG